MDSWLLSQAAWRLSSKQIDDFRHLIDEYIRQRALESFLARVNGEADSYPNEEMKMKGLSEFARDLSVLLENS